MAPAFADLALQHAASSAIKIAKVDCTTNTKTCTDVGIRGYPSLMLFKDGEFEAKYEGGRTLDAMNAFVKEATGEVPAAEVPYVDETVVEFLNGQGELTDENFDAGVESGVTFVKFYAPWCGHCKRLAPVWEKLAAHFASNKAVTVANMDCTQSNKVCTRQGVRGYPTLVVYTDGIKTVKHSGARTFEALAEFLEGYADEHANAAGHDEL
jgi:thioredoxin domain-containing protein 5